MRLTALALTVCLAASPSLARAADPAAPAPAQTPDPAATAQSASSNSSSSEVVATAAGAPASPAQPTDSVLTRWLKQAPPVSLGDDYDSGVIPQGAPDRTIHGEVGVGVGSGGYRDVYGAVTMPVGKTGELGVAVEDTQFSKPFHVDARRLDVNLALGGSGAAAPADCASALRVGDHYVEPLWVTRMRGYALQDADPRCVSAIAPSSPPPR